MNELVLPPAPHWFKSSALACSPDNTLVYGSKNDLVIIKEKKPDEAVNVEFIYGAHSKHITSVSLNRKWKEPYSYVASLGEDSVIKIWDLATCEKRSSNRDHMAHTEAVIGAVFAGDDRVVSAASNGFVVVWNIISNESKTVKDLFKSKVTVTCLSSCPHAGWLLAFGLSNGGVVIADLRRNGQVLYNLRGHYQSVVSLSWCPAPVNVFPRHPGNKVANKPADAEVDSTPDKSTETEVNESVTLSERCAYGDFLKECEELRNKILGLEVSITKTMKEDACPRMEDKTYEAEEEEAVHEIQNRSFPTIFDPSFDFLDDSGVAESSPEESIEEEGAVRSKLIVAPDSTADKIVTVGETNEISKENVIETGKVHEIDEDSGVIGSIEKKDVNETMEKKDQSKNEKPKTQQDIETENSQEVNEAIGVTVHDGKESIEKTDEAKEVKPKTDENAASAALENSPEVDEVNGAIDQDSAKQDKGVNKSPLESTNQTRVEEHNADDIKSENSQETIEADDITQQNSSRQELDEEPRTEYLLASSGKDKKVYIWRAGTDGRMQTFFSVSRRKSRKEKHTSSWITLCWATPSTILTSSATGEVLAWAIPKPTSNQYSYVHNEHSSLVFNIVTAPKYPTAYNWREKIDYNVWTWGQDGKLINYDYNEHKLRYSYLTMSSMITCFGSSSLDPNRLAVGLRDGGIRVWDLSVPHSNIVTMRKYQHKYTHKVCVIDWHPLKETILGFGTEEGRVGFIDLASNKATLFPHYFRTQVYKVEWGPINRDKKNLGLYALSEGKIAIYDIQKPNEDPTQMELPEKLCAYKFAWKPDFTLLLLNGKDGSLIILKDDLTIITTTYPSEKGLNAIVWHPDASTDKTDISPRCNWFAATVTKGILVVDANLTTESDNFADKIIASFEGHLKPPLAVMWCPYDGLRIVSTAADGLAHVWDVETKTLIATFADSYLSHFSPLALAWSPSDHNLIIKGDRTIKIWNITDNPPKSDEEFLQARKRLLSKAAKNESEKSDKNKVKDDASVKLKSNSKNYIVPSFNVPNDGNISLQVATMRELMNGIEEESNKLNPLLQFGTKEQMTLLLDLNYEQQKNQGKYKSCEFISLWKGNVGEHIRNAINENRVTPSIITMAPMISPKLWQDACLSYAQKLVEEAKSDPLEIAMYFLCCHKIEEAIDCLCNNLMFKEALALGKQRLPENSDITMKIMEKWAEYSTNIGNFENAAYCYLSIKNYENAARVLSRRNNLEFLEFAGELAEKAGNKNLYDCIMLKCTEIKNEEDVSNDVEEVPSRIDAMLTTVETADESDDTVEQNATSC